MAVTSVNDEMNKKNNHLVDNCCVIVERFDQYIVKKKRGRPKRLVAQNDVPLLLNCDKNSVAPNLSGFELKENNPQIIEKKSRGRPKQNVSNKSNESKSKKRKKRKRVYTKKKMHTVNKLDEKEVIPEMSIVSKKTNLDVDYEIANNKNIDSNNQALKENDLITQSDLYFENVTLDFNEINWNIRLPKNVKSKSLILQRKNECINSCVEDTNILSLYSHKTNSDIIYSERGRSKSFTTYIEKTPEDIGEFETLNLKQYSKSVSYLDPGPNIHMKRYDKYELMKIYKSKLRRIRTFPNCLAMDSSALNFLVNNMEFYYGEYNKIYHNEEIFSDNEFDEEIEEEIHLINNTTECRFNREYRSKSVPLEKNEKITKKEKVDYMYKSFDNLKELCDINDLHPITFKILSDKCDLKTIENDLDESDNKIRRSKRLNNKNALLQEQYLFIGNEPKFDYLMLAQEIREEHERQLSNARKIDEEFENKLKTLDFTLITDNIFKPHKKDISKCTSAENYEIRKLKPKTNNMDTFNCHCKYSKEDQIQGKQGCESECLNRLLNIECGPSCSLMAICSNKQFQNKQIKRTEIVKTPNKGYGLFAVEDIPSGTFIDEYMGEVINNRQMIKRLQSDLYIGNNYMVQLKHNVIIDATCKGNVTRFINHSCQPNCVAEKWNVLGESRMGFFSKTSIKKGDEITFDYSFEIFGDTAQQKCYCGTFKCRGFISKKCRNLDHNSSSDESDNQSSLISTAVPKKKTKIIKNYNKNLLQELDEKLTNISKLKNKNRSDLENSTLNLNKLMVHITDSISQLHILKFIRENDLNCKKLFMSFNGLSILHNWMVSNNNDEILKLEIIRTLSDLPISNRNTISKSKVLDVVADWANIPKNVKNIIESLEFPVLKQIQHIEEVNRLFPDQNNTSPLIQSARNLWKKWIVLKMVFKIPKLDPSKVNIPNAIDNLLSVSSHQETSLSHFNLEYRNGNCKITPIDFQNKLSYVKNGRNETQEYSKSDTANRFNNIFQHRIQFNNRQENQLTLEWNKKYRKAASKSNNIKLISNSLHGLNLDNEQEIPVICGMPSKKIKWNSPEMVSNSYEVVPTDTVKFGFGKKILQTECELYPIEEIITTDQMHNLSPPSIVELNNEFILQFILNMTPNEYISNGCNETIKYIISHNEPFLHVMKPENVLYDSQHPNIKDQTYEDNKNNNLISIPNTDFINTDVNVIRPKKHFNLKQCKHNTEKLSRKCSLDNMKSARQNYDDLSPIKLSFLKKITFKPQLHTKKYGNGLVSHNLFKCIKVASNFYQNQPSRIIKMNTVFQGTQRLKEISGVDESNKSDSIFLGFKVHNDEQLETTTDTQILNIKKSLMKQSIPIKHKNKFADKILNAFVKNTKKYIPDKFSLKLCSDTKQLHTLGLIEENEFLHHQLIPTAKNSLCAKKNDKFIINMFKKNLMIKKNDSKSLKRVNESESIKNSVLLNSSVETNAITVQRPLKRKLPLPHTTNKRKKLIEVSRRYFNKLKNDLRTNCKDTNIPIFQKASVPEKIEEFCINNSSENNSNTSNEIEDYSSLNTNTITSNEIATDHFEVPDELMQKPCMKCLPFQQINGGVMSTQSNNELIDPIVNSFMNSIGFNRTSARPKLVDDPIVKDYLQRMELQVVGPKRKFKLPESMMSLPIEVLNLVPDNQAEIKCVVDFYHNMATVIVKILDSYVKKNCKQGRIKTDADFKFLAKKLNSNILYKELQAKNINELRITEHMKQKVKQYITTYMLKFGKVYRKKSFSK